MVAHLVFAGGRGTRLFGASPGCKAAQVLGEHFRVIDYCLQEIPPSLVSERIILLTPGVCPELRNSSSLDPITRVVDAPARGTGSAVQELIGLTSDDLMIVMPGDVVGHSGRLRHFTSEALHRLRDADGPRCYVACPEDRLDESDPVSICMNSEGSVEWIKKGVTKTGAVWGGVRIMNRL